MVQWRLLVVVEEEVWATVLIVNHGLMYHSWGNVLVFKGETVSLFDQGY